MKINSKLVKAASFNPTEKSHQMTVVGMCKKIEAREISLPLYQRDLSWTLQKCIDLLNYQLLGKAPVSPISINVINDIKNYIPQVSFIDRDDIYEIDRGQYSVVDGQQRLTTNYKAYSNHNDFRNIVLDLAKGRFLQTEEGIKNHQIPVGILLNKDDAILFGYCGKSPSLNLPSITNVLLQVKNKIKSYNYTINSAEDLTEDEQIHWFEVLNNAGSRVSMIQARFSKLKIHGIDIYNDYTKKFKEKLSEAGYDDFYTPQKTEVSYPIAALNPAYEFITHKKHKSNYAPMASDTKQNQLCRLSQDKLEKCFLLTLSALDKTINFIDENELEKPKRIDYINYLIGFFIFCNDELNEEKKDIVVQWFNDADFVNKSNPERREMFDELINIAIN